MVVAENNPAHPPYLLGLDIGGTGVKAGLFTLDGQLAGSGYSEYRMISTLPGQAEHDAEGWWQASIAAIRAAIAGVPPESILALGVGCTNGLIAVDAEGRPLRPAIMLWDQRSLPEVARIKAALDADRVFEITGNPVAPGAFSLPTILWLKHNEPHIFAAAHKLMVPGGYLVARLTGEFTIDYSRACTTLLFDIQRHEWHQPFLSALEIPEDKLPQPLPSQAVAGGVTAAAADLTGLKQGMPVLAGCMDTVGASIGSGVMTAGESFVIMGTAARVSTPLDAPRFDPRFMHCTHVLPDSWLSIGALNGVGSALRWIRDTCGQMEQAEAERTGQNVYDLLTAQADQAPPGSKGLVFLPYMSGERTPIWDPYARGVFFGVTLGHTRADLLRSVLEGPAFAMRHAIEILERDAGAVINELKIGGSAAESRVWNQIIADVLGKRVVSLTASHIEVLGAAVLAGVGVGAYADYASALARVIRLGDAFDPDPRSHAIYNELFPIYTDLYPDVKPYFERLAQLDLPQVWVTRRETGHD